MMISQAVSFLIAVACLRSKDAIFNFRYDKLILIVGVGFPFAGQLVIVNISYLLVAGMLNKHGIDVAAASGIGLKINTFAAMPCWAVGQAIITIVSRNLPVGWTAFGVPR